MNCLLCNAPLNYHLGILDLVKLAPLSFRVICRKCAKSFDQIDSAMACPGCSRPQTKGHLCPECQRWAKQYGWHLHHAALYTYNEAMKKFMRRYKFQGDYRLRRVFQDEFCRQVQSYHADLVIPIPVTVTTMAIRGFNQVLGLLGPITVATDILAHQARDKVAQSHKTRHQRIATPQPFYLINSTIIRDKKVLLVDDIYTTGRTLYHAANLIKQAGCREILSLSLAR